MTESAIQVRENPYSGKLCAVEGLEIIKKLQIGVWNINVFHSVFLDYTLNANILRTLTWLLLTFFLSLHNQFLHFLLSHIKEYRCLKNVTQQIDKNEWLLLSAFQQGLLQKLSCFLS